MTSHWKLLFVVGALATGGIGLAFAQAPATPPPAVDPVTGGPVNNWRPPSSAPGAGGNLQPMSNAPRASIAKVTSGTGTLPNDAGQIWREYDITPYTLRVTSTNRPEQAIVDWILRETGYDAWHSDPLGILCANGRTLRRLSHSANAGTSFRNCRSFRQQPNRGASLLHPLDYAKQSQLARQNAASAPPRTCAKSGRAGVAVVERRRRHDDRRTAKT